MKTPCLKKRRKKKRNADNSIQKSQSKDNPVSATHTITGRGLSNESKLSNSSKASTGSNVGDNTHDDNSTIFEDVFIRPPPDRTTHHNFCDFSVALIAFSSRPHLFTFPPNFCASMVDIPDLDDPFLPSPEFLVAQSSAGLSHVYDALDDLPEIMKRNLSFMNPNQTATSALNTDDNASSAALGSALVLARLIGCAYGGQVLTFACGSPSIGLLTPPLARQRALDSARASLNLPPPIGRNQKTVSSRDVLSSLKGGSNSNVDHLKTSEATSRWSGLRPASKEEIEDSGFNERVGQQASHSGAGTAELELLWPDEESVAYEAIREFSDSFVDVSLSLSMFICPIQVTDISTFGRLCHLTGGNLFMHSLASVTAGGSPIRVDISRVLRRRTGFEALLTVRSTEDIIIRDFFGHGRALPRRPYPRFLNPSALSSPLDFLPLDQPSPFYRIGAALDYDDTFQNSNNTTSDISRFISTASKGCILSPPRGSSKFPARKQRLYPRSVVTIQNDHQDFDEDREHVSRAFAGEIRSYASRLADSAGLVLELAVIHPDTSVGVAIERRLLTEEQKLKLNSIARRRGNFMVSGIQVSMIYTATDGSRRLRIHNWFAPHTDSHIATQGIDHPTLSVALMRDLVRSAAHSSISETTGLIIEMLKKCLPYFVSHTDESALKAAAAVVEPPIRAANRFKSTHPAWKLVCLAQGCLRSPFIRLAADVSLEERAHLWVDLQTAPVSVIYAMIQPVIYPVHGIVRTGISSSEKDNNPRLKSSTTSDFLYDPDGLPVHLASPMPVDNKCDSFKPQGSYLINYGSYMVLLVGRHVAPGWLLSVFSSPDASTLLMLPDMAVALMNTSRKQGNSGDLRRVYSGSSATTTLSCPSLTACGSFPAAEVVESIIKQIVMQSLSSNSDTKPGIRLASSQQVQGALLKTFIDELRDKIIFQHTRHSAMPHPYNSKLNENHAKFRHIPLLVVGEESPAALAFSRRACYLDSDPSVVGKLRIGDVEHFMKYVGDHAAVKIAPGVIQPDLFVSKLIGGMMAATKSAREKKNSMATTKTQSVRRMNDEHDGAHIGLVSMAVEDVSISTSKHSKTDFHGLKEPPGMLKRPVILGLPRRMSLEASIKGYGIDDNDLQCWEDNRQQLMKALERENAIEKRVAAKLLSERSLKNGTAFDEYDKVTGWNQQTEIKKNSTKYKNILKREKNPLRTLTLNDEQQSPFSHEDMNEEVSDDYNHLEKSIDENEESADLNVVVHHHTSWSALSLMFPVSKLPNEKEF